MQIDLFWDIFISCVAGCCHRTAATHLHGLISWLYLINIRSWLITAACCKSITTRATSKVTSLRRHTLGGSACWGVIYHPFRQKKFANKLHICAVTVWDLGHILHRHYPWSASTDRIVCVVWCIVNAPCTMVRTKQAIANPGMVEPWYPLAMRMQADQQTKQRKEHAIPHLVVCVTTEKMS